MIEAYNPDPTIPELIARHGERFCYLRHARAGDGVEVAKCLVEGAEDTYVNPEGEFGATKSAINEYLYTGEEALIVRKGVEYWERFIAARSGDGTFRVVARRDTGRPIAFSVLSIDDSKYELPLCELDAIYGLRAWRRRIGYHAGSMLMNDAMLRAQDSGRVIHALTTTWNPALRRFYKDFCGAEIVQEDAVSAKIDPLTRLGIDLRQAGVGLFSSEQLSWSNARKREYLEYLKCVVYPARPDAVDFAGRYAKN